MYEQCYSSFTHPRDVIEREGPFSTSSSSVYINRLAPFAINGFYCFRHNFGFFSKNINSVNPKINWWMIDLKREITVESIIVVVPTDNPPASYFEHAIIRLGNDATYSNNMKVFEHNERPEHRMPFTLTFSSSHSGRYLSIESSKLDHLALGLVQVIEKM